MRPAAVKPLLLVFVWLAACATSPLGRDQLILFPEEQVAEMGAAAYQEMRQNARLARNSEVNDYVHCVTDALADVPAADGASQEWEVSVFEEDQVNAFALPGGKIGVYQGLLDVAGNQHQLAAVIAHEMAHVLARHSNERISTHYAAGAGLDLIGVIAGADTPGKQTLLGLLGLGTQVGVLLPFGRSQETEADLVGVELMARAGFDPRQSVQLWENMAEESGQAPPEFLSTHPSSESRIRTLQDALPQVLPLAEQARASGRDPACR